MSKPVVIELYGTGAHNRGAELMANAVARHFAARFPEVQLAVSDTFGAYRHRARYTFLLTPEFSPGSGAGLLSLFLRTSAPAVREVLGLARPSEITMVIDASGFAFSDQWGAVPAKFLLRRLKFKRRPHIPLILMPQAFGPFKIPRVARLTRKLCARATLIFARDQTSLAALQELGAPPERLRLCPDFTIDVPARDCVALQLPDSFVGIVPNYRMLDMRRQSGDYLEFLTRVVQYLRQIGENPVFIPHAPHEDRPVMEALAQKGMALPVYEDRDPEVLKKILGSARFVIASRYHAIVSALSMRVPCLGAGWSHKYPELFRDFGCPDLLLDDLRDWDAVKQSIDRLVSAAERRAIQSRLDASLTKMRQSVAKMWAEIDELAQQTILAARAPETGR